MTEDRSRAIGAWCSIVTTFVTASGLIVIAFQISSFLETRKTENRKKQEELVAKLYFTDIDLNKLLIQEPLIQQVMYDDPRGDFFQKLQEIDKLKCNAVSQMYGDLLEYYVMLEKSLETADEDSKQMAYCWEQYIKYLWKNSFAFRRYIVLTKDTWTPRFLEKFPPEEFGRLENDLKSR
jgi:hypothetical protein